MWYFVIGGGGLVSVTAAGIKAWSAVAAQWSRERSVDRLALARENGADFDLPAAIEQLHVPRAKPEHAREPRRIVRPAT